MSTATPAAAEGTITLTDSGCTSEGLAEVIPADLRVAVVNTTSSRAAFNLQRLRDGNTYLELEQFIKARHTAAAAGNVVQRELPPMSIHMAGTDVEPGQRGTLDVVIPLGSGTYGLVCRRDSPTGTIEANFVLGPFRVD